MRGVGLQVEAALAGGALGARMMGAGFRGPALALVPADRVAEVKEATADRARAAGHPDPSIVAAELSDGAGREA